MEITPCINCGQQPKIVEMYDMFYVQCLCGFWNPNAFVAITKKKAYAQWNFENAERPPIPVVHKPKSNVVLYKYYVRGIEMTLDGLAEYLDVTKKYINNRFYYYGTNVITIKHIQIERKESRHANIPEK